MLTILSMDLLDTTIEADLSLLLENGTTLRLEVQLGVEYKQDEMVIQPFHIGSTISRGSRENVGSGPLHRA